ncbi:toprim domain-containing protein [Salinicola corii]|uniref:Toprim domain-containing protein n=1 Tax=Salinicola corii TaxID=2606937 RepID=A0A640WAF3_9GAMM|nr:PriCT-2 domain-containing protein [Salinicola corii]KAA0017121.1 toprim domain-containing protein [Salinicola corii]
MSLITTLEEAAQVVAFIAPDDRDLWINVGNALKSEFGEDAFDTWDAWSQGAQSYNAADAKSVWRSLSLGCVSFGFVVNEAKRNGWKPTRRELSAADKRQMRQEAEQRRKDRQASIEADAAKLEAMQRQVGMACRLILKNHVQPTGPSQYLGTKQVQAHGVLFPRHSVLIGIDDQAQRVEVWPGEEVKRYFEALPKPRPDHISFLLIKKGDIIIPLRDGTGHVWSIQVIKPEGKKLFPKYGRKAGCFHLIGDPTAADTIAEVEGYATGASVHEATGWPVAVALDSGNLQRVGQTLKLAYPEHRLVIAGDDDPDNPKNPGRKKAEEVARGLGAVAVFPTLGEVA